MLDCLEGGFDFATNRRTDVIHRLEHPLDLRRQRLRLDAFDGRHSRRSGASKGPEKGGKGKPAAGVPQTHAKRFGRFHLLWLKLDVASEVARIGPGLKA